jgi:hypothetical protein
MYELSTRPDLAAPVLVAAFDGWVSAGAAGTATADHVAADGETIARFDSDRLYDYRVHRPSLTFQDGIVTAIDWPEIIVRRRRVEQRDLLVMTGPEPNWQWQAFGEAVADLCTELGVVEFISLGGIPWAAPHTRPTIVVTTSSRPELLGDDANLPPGRLQVPASVVSTVGTTVADRGIPTVGLWARVPHYVGGTYHPAVVTLVERLSLHLGVRIPLGSLVDDSSSQRAQLDEAVLDQEGVSDVVAQLEALYDSGGDVASGEEIAAEFEKYLRETGTEDPA